MHLKHEIENIGPICKVKNRMGCDEKLNASLNFTKNLFKHKKKRKKENIKPSIQWALIATGKQASDVI